MKEQLAEMSVLTCVLAILVLAVLSGLIGAAIYRAISQKQQSDSRPIYWNLIIFAVIGALFSITAMFMVGDEQQNGIALLYLGMVAGYAASIKELDLAKIEIEKMKLQRRLNETLDQDDNNTENTEKPDKQ